MPKKRASWAYSFETRSRWISRLWFRLLRQLVFFMWRLWVRRIENFDRIPSIGPAIIVSNHLSYFDFFIMASILKRQTVFVAVKGLNQRSFVGWFMKLDTIIYVDRDKPGYRFFKDLIWHIREQERQVVIYPEGTRSRTGKMLAPKLGFVKLAMRTGAPVIPVAFRGTFEILPPQKHIPRFRKCNVCVGEKIYISPSNPEFHDVFFRRKTEGRQFKDLEDAELQEIAFRIMDKVRKMSGQEWDESVIRPALNTALHHSDNPISR